MAPMYVLVVQESSIQAKSVYDDLVRYVKLEFVKDAHKEFISLEKIYYDIERTVASFPNLRCRLMLKRVEKLYRKASQLIGTISN